MDVLTVSAYRQCKDSHSDYIPDHISFAVIQTLGDDYHILDTT